MPAQLVALDDGPSILLDKPILLLGRHPECDIQIDSRKISRRHCCIAQVNDYLVVRDLGSTNGIRINSVRVLEGRLVPGDELTIGSHRYQVSWEAVVAAPPRTPSKRRKDTVHSRFPPEEAADDVLESCDEPIPLPEPDDAPAAAPPARPAGDPPRIGPEHLGLMPGNAPGSHPPR